LVLFEKYTPIHFSKSKSMLKKLVFGKLNFKIILLLHVLVFFHQFILAQEVIRKTYYDDANTLIKEQYYVDDTIQNKLNGSYTAFYISGVTKSIGYFKANLADSTWNYYNELGRLKQTGNYDSGISTGEWTNYFENGSVQSIGNLTNNIKTEEWIYYYENGKIKSRGSFENNKKQGVWNYLFEDGKLKAQAYFEDDTGRYKEFFASGSLKMEGLNKNGKSDSLWVYYFETGEKLAEGYFENGLKTGTWKYFHENQKIASEGGYADGKTLGNWIYYHENGNKSAEGIQSDDLKDGYWKLYYQEGTLKGLGQFEMGTGDYKEYYNSGNLKIDGQFKDGLNDGHWEYFDETGLIEGEADFVAGRGNYVGYYQDNEKKMEGVLEKGKRVGEWKLYKTTGELAGTYHPLYEEELPIYLTSENIQEKVVKRPTSNPGFKLQGKKLRYFTPKINEYKGYIFSTNPLLSLVGQLPISIEYYIQERLGFEITYKYLRDPFFEFASDKKIRELLSSGHSLNFTNKFYSKDNKYGMFYFGHQFGYDFLNHDVNIYSDQAPFIGNDIQAISSNEKRWHYALIVGDRWLREPARPGLTFDIYFGVGIGKRSFSKKYENTIHDPLFSSVKQSDSYFPFIFGLSIGYLGLGKTKALKHPTLKPKNSK
jgi:antitoxin component YwqK of YwqJK toxin-antitoxin module